MKQPLLLFFILIVNFGGCQSDNKTFLINDSKLLTAGLLNTIKLKQYDKMKLFYSDGFYHSITEEQWVNDVKKIDEKLGHIESYELIETLVNTENGTQSIILTYSVKRTNYTTKEKFEILNFKGKLKIRSHNIKI